MRDVTPHTTEAQGAWQPPAAATASSAADLLLGRYRVMGACGTGGFGAVLICWDTRLQRRVAIKRMPLSQPGSFTSRQIIDEALAEARTSSMLANPNIVTMYDFEVDHQWAYLVMEFVDGLTLTELLSRVEGGTLTNDEVAYLVEHVGDALGYAHENGVLHLDVKPSNIMFERNGAVKICDFGMATLASAAGYGGARGGTVGYMPPEQIVGDLVDERSDVFSLAVVCWQALEGQNPFAAATAEESLKKIERGPRRDIAKLDGSIGGMAAEAIMQAVSPSPASRPPSVESFARCVAFGLGDPDAGAESIRGLMAQSTDEGAGDETLLRAWLPLAYRYPWLLGSLTRLASALVVLWAVAMTSGAYAPALGVSRPVVCVLAAAATAAWPPAGSVLATASLAAAVLTASAGAEGMLLSLVVFAVVLTWWATTGRGDSLSSCALLLGPCARNPLLGAPLASLAERPGSAGVTAAVSWLLSWVVTVLAPAGFDATGGVAALLERLGSLSALTSCVGCVVAAALSSGISRRWPSVRGGVMGQVVCAGVVVGAQLLAARVENGGIWTPASWVNPLVALLLGVVLCLWVFVRGPLSTDRKVDEFDEAA
ncbi:serine/threonine-protein kinase [Olsenella sp. HMSC062G07]|uniref:protein kinase domain-containing protein n=1 Tax=Olsenella sp. HMSC062G07 TaxID=1739330 RepID=UPI0008A21269|nr:serine/threonine-protein kinase [Olsenella sp. HMSC062G07]OFK22229.1 hypothetical protein HMPREF2826_02115 [Olsenella sp. HMSC062G07]